MRSVARQYLVATRRSRCGKNSKIKGFWIRSRPSDPARFWIALGMCLKAAASRIFSYDGIVRYWHQSITYQQRSYVVNSKRKEVKTKKMWIWIGLQDRPVPLQYDFYRCLILNVFKTDLTSSGSRTDKKRADVPPGPGVLPVKVRSVSRLSIGFMRTCYTDMFHKRLVSSQFSKYLHNCFLYFLRS